MDTFIQERNTGSLESTVNTLSGRDTEVSGGIENIPVNEINVGFHTLEEDEYEEVNVEELTEDDQCGRPGDLEEIEEEKASGTEILRTVEEQGDEPGSMSFEERYGVKLYFADTGAQFDEDVQYDSVWVDNSSECQFADEDGPFRLNEHFKWGDNETDEPEDWFTFKGIENEEHLRVHNATQVRNFELMLDETLAGIPTETEVNTFRFDEDIEDLDITIFRETQSLEEIDDSILDEYLEEKPAIFLLESETDYNDFQGTYLDDAGFRWMNFDNIGEIEYEDDTYDGSTTSSSFSEHPTSDRVLTYFNGLGGDEGSLEINPPGKIVSAEDSMTTEDPLLESNEHNYNTSVFEIEKELPGSEPWEGEMDFADETYDVRNLILEGGGTVASEIDTNHDGEYDEGPLLIGEEVIIDQVNYMAFPTCQDQSSECAEFLFAGSSNVELIPHRTSLDNVDEGESVSIAGYQSSYDEEQLKLLTALIYYKSEDEMAFEGAEEPSDIETSVIGSIGKDEIEKPHIPYRLDLRWSR